jgi:2-C-methyl-D-erythritol 4-phosphate cytidylyltransferase
MSAWAILAAAGEGSRLGGGPKAFVPLGGLPLVTHSLVAFAKASGIDGIVVVVPAGAEEEARAIAASAVPSARVEVVPGGASRQASVRAGLAAVPSSAERVVVHDAARPLVGVGLIEAALAALGEASGSVAAIPESDTLKRADGAAIRETIPRAGVFRAQTPQAFRTPVLRAAHERAAADGFDATDDAMLLERMGERVVVVPGDERNVKVTTPEDLAIAEALLAAAQGGGR